MHTFIRKSNHYDSFQLNNIDPIFHPKNRRQSQQLYKARAFINRYGNLILWFFICGLEVFNSSSDHIIHSLPNGYHTLFVSARGYTRKFRVNFDVQFLKVREANIVREKCFGRSLTCTGLGSFQQIQEGSILPSCKAHIHAHTHTFEHWKWAWQGACRILKLNLTALLPSSTIIVSLV